MNGESPLATRRKAFYFIITAAAVVFVLRLSQLQLFSQEQYGKKSEENSVRPAVKEPIRGYMFDRNKRLIVDSRASYSVTVTPSEFKENLVPLLSSVLEVDSELIKDRIRRGRLYSIFAPTRIKRDVDFKTLAFIEENRDRLSGVGYHVETRRSYPTEVQASHLLGYAREISEQQLGKSDGFYKPGDLIGFAGLEAFITQALVCDPVQAAILSIELDTALRILQCDHGLFLRWGCRTLWGAAGRNRESATIIGE